jgi:hypothetical protein
MHSFLLVALPLLLASFAHGVALPGIRNHWSDPYSLRPNPLYPYYARSRAARLPGSTSTYDSRFWKDPDVSPSRTRHSVTKTKTGVLRLQSRQDAPTTSDRDLDTRPTPEPTGIPSLQTTVHINSDMDIALLLPRTPGGMFGFCSGHEVRDANQHTFSSELVSEAEEDGIAYCTPGNASNLCEDRVMPDGFITAASFARAADDSWIQVLHDSP